MKKSLAATLLVAGIWSAGGAGAETGVTDKTILVGTSQSLSGPLAGPGQEQVTAMEAYMEYVNAQGGVNGRRLEWKWYDDGYRPQDAMANTRRLVEQDGVFVVPVNQGTSAVLAVVPYLQEKKVPLLFPFQGGSELDGKKHIFTSFTYYDEQTRITARYLVEKKGMKRIGILYQDDAYGEAFLNTLKTELKAMGLEIAGAESVKRGVNDVAPQVAKLSAASLDACLLVVTPGPGAQVLKEAAKTGWTKTKLVSSGPLTDEKFLILSGGEGEGVLGLSLWPDPVHSQSPAMKKFREILAKYRPKVSPSRYTLYGYFYAMTMVEGMKRAGKDLTRESLIKGLESIQNWDNGFISPVSFGPNDHHTQDDGYMVEVKGGRFVPISGWLAMRGGKLVETPLKE